MIKAPSAAMRAPRSARVCCVADDHQALLALTAETLAGECLVAGRLGDGCELLAEAERRHPDVIVLDITMPRLDGSEAARQLRRSHGLPALSSSRSTKTPTTPGPRSMRAGSAMLLRRGSLPISSLPYGQPLPIVPSSRQTSNSMKRD